MSCRYWRRLLTIVRTPPTRARIPDDAIRNRCVPPSCVARPCTGSDMALIHPSACVTCGRDRYSPERIPRAGPVAIRPVPWISARGSRTSPPGHPCAGPLGEGGRSGHRSEPAGRAVLSTTPNRGQPSDVRASVDIPATTIDLSQLTTREATGPGTVRNRSGNLTPGGIGTPELYGWRRRGETSTVLLPLPMEAWDESRHHRCHPPGNHGASGGAASGIVDTRRRGSRRRSPAAPPATSVRLRSRGTQTCLPSRTAATISATASSTGTALFCEPSR
ncbi:hypothetical protein FHX37_2075 [Haloactinospora alba]|uniref:Uncharacterized protein n=1 Tax=Haloactinospora alba TaxID=405555 RepID=A0A543NK06_9ACTN|nr:hypothetical protein FHX37_2075 [Haloactinospora alba]